MHIEKKIMDGKINVVCDEKEIRRVIQRSKSVFVQSESERILPYCEFLFRQIRMTQKRWWILQLLLLSAAWYLLRVENKAFYVRGEMGIIAAMFVIFIIPELWKNLSNHCMEIEMTAYYSLRRIYAARLMLFGGVDLVLITIFIVCAFAMLRVSLIELVTAFLLPLIITAGICFLILSFHNQKMGVVTGACVAWSVVWWIVSVNEKLYNMITTPMWIGMLVLACLFMLYTIYRVFSSCKRLWEVNINETIFE